MAKIIPNMAVVSTRPTTTNYPWVEWFDGQARILYTKAGAQAAGETTHDLDDGINMSALRATAYRKAANAGGHVEINFPDGLTGQRVALQFHRGPGPRAGRTRPTDTTTPEKADNPPEVAPTEVATRTPGVAPPTAVVGFQLPQVDPTHPFCEPTN